MNFTTTFSPHNIHIIFSLLLDEIKKITKTRLQQLNRLDCPARKKDKQRAMQVTSVWETPPLRTTAFYRRRAVVTTSKRSATDCIAAGASFPKWMIYLARRWTGGITKNYEVVMNLIKCACTLPCNSRDALPASWKIAVHYLRNAVSTLYNKFNFVRINIPNLTLNPRKINVTAWKSIGITKISSKMKSTKLA